MADKLVTDGKSNEDCWRQNRNVENRLMYNRMLNDNRQQLLWIMTTIMTMATIMTRDMMNNI